MVGLDGARHAADIPVRGGGLQWWGSGYALQFAVQSAIGEHYEAAGLSVGRERCCVRERLDYRPDQWCADHSGSDRIV